MPYAAPVEDIMFAIRTVSAAGSADRDWTYHGLDDGTMRAIVEEAGRIGADVLSPINRSGDREGCALKAGVVATPPGFRAAYRQFIDGGWNSLSAPEAYGGQGLPGLAAMAVAEIWSGANIAFGLCPMLTQGAIHAIEAGGSAVLKDTYLTEMVAGRWTGTMNLTEPNAGSDLSLLTTRASPISDGSYKISGTKIFITFGEHDLAENIIHLVLARLPNAPAGTKGISLFLVPKFLLLPDGSLGARNDVVCTGIEHKLGIAASPTCVMQFGDHGGAIGYLIGEENRGLQTMFVMMNQARLAVAVQGVGIAERATQAAVAFAAERRQGRATGQPPGATSPIADHPDVRRMLLTMRALTAAARFISLATAREMDRSSRSSDRRDATAGADLAALLTPVAKAFSTDIACEVASLGIQVHGGMGFVEETGVAQFYRDARILPIYEGTNGIQAIDLVARKLTLNNGAALRAYLSWLRETAALANSSNRTGLSKIGERLSDAVASLIVATDWIVEALATSPDAALASATPYLRLFALTSGGSYFAQGAMVDGNRSCDHTALARFYADNLLTAAPGLAATVISGADSIVGTEIERLAS